LHFCNDCYLDFFSPLIFENIYENEKFSSYNEFHEGRDYIPEWTKEVIKVINKKNISLKNKTILEIGAGDGINYTAFKQNLSIGNKNYYGLELDKKSIKICKKRGIKNIINTYFNKNFKSKSKFDLILILEVLEHQIDPKSFFEAVFTNLNKNGLVIISVPYRNRSFLKFKENPGDVPPHHFLRFNKKFFKKNFNLFYISTYNSHNKKIILSSKILSKELFKTHLYYLFLIPVILLLRIYDFFVGEGLICIIKNKNFKK
jgi:SAM-dependent methyltransferase